MLRFIASRFALLVFSIATLTSVQCASSLAAQQTVDELSTWPGTPTWSERVVFTASGTAVQFRGLEAVEVAAPEVGVQQVPFAAPIDPPIPGGYEYTVDLPRLHPGDWTVVYEQRNGVELGRLDFRVYATENVTIEAVPSDRGPRAFAIRVAGYGCGAFDLSGEITDFVYRSETVCDFGDVPLAPSYFEFEEIGTFPAGERVRAAVQVDLSFERSVVAATTFTVPQDVVVPPSLCERSVPVWLCLGDGGRFQLTLELENGVSVGVARPFALSADDPYSSTGFFSVFDPDNLEVTVKVPDGCAIDGHFWLFASWGTTLQADLTANDLETGLERVYSKPADQLSLPVADVEAFRAVRRSEVESYPSERVWRPSNRINRINRRIEAS